MPLAASTYTFGDGLLTVLELAFLFLWIWIAIGVVFDRRSTKRSASSRKGRTQLAPWTTSASSPTSGIAEC